MLPENVNTLAELTGRWWVAHTKSRFEKSFAWDMLRRDVGYFLPMIEKVKIYSGKKRKVLIPLFPSYVFVCGSEQDRYNALATNRICRMIDVTDQQELINELLAIEKTVTSQAEIEPYPYPPKGSKCRIAAGSLKGLEGVVIRKTKRARLVLQVSILGQGAAIEIDADLLERTD